MVGVEEKMLQLAVVELVEVDLAVLERVPDYQLARRIALLDCVADPVVGRDGFVDWVPEAKGLFGNSNAKAPLEGADGVWGGVAEVIEGEPLHDEPHRVARVLSSFFHKQAAAGGALVPLTHVVAGFALAFLRHLF